MALPLSMCNDGNLRAISLEELQQTKTDPAPALVWAFLWRASEQGSNARSQGVRVRRRRHKRVVVHHQVIEHLE